MVDQFSLTRQHEQIADELTEAFDRVLSSGQFILGEEVERFEENMARWIGVDHVVGCASGTDALQLALMAAGLGPGDEVVVPAFTFVATAGAVLAVGATPVLADVSPWDALVTRKTVEPVMSARTRAVIAVHLYGNVAAMTELRELCWERDALLIEDAAQAMGGRLDGQQVGTLGDMACFSFFPTKTLGALGDGGAVSTNSARFADRLRMLRAHGSREKYVHVAVGRNSRLDALQAAFLDVKLKHLTEWLDRRTSIAEMYVQRLQELDVVSLPRIRPGVTHTWHQFAVVSKLLGRDTLRTGLKQRGVDASVHYPMTLNQQRFWAAKGLAPGRYVDAEKWSNTVLCLPIWPEMTDDEVEEVCSAVREEVHSHRSSINLTNVVH